MKRVVDEAKRNEIDNTGTRLKSRGLSTEELWFLREKVMDPERGKNEKKKISLPKMTTDISRRISNWNSGFSNNLNHRSTVKNMMLLILSLLVTGCSSRSGVLFDMEGPNSFTQEPPRFNYFTNDKGLLLYCGARGSPKPSVMWMDASTGEPLGDVNGLRQVLTNGSLHYLPFSLAFYRADIHNATVYCQAGNLGGQIRSRDVVVRAEIKGRREVELDDAFTTVGNDAVLKCLIPEAIRDFVSVTSWIKDSTFNIFPHAGGGGGRFLMLPSGELLVEGTSFNDSTSTFQCRTVNRLTGKTSESESFARIMLRGGDRDAEPRMLGPSVVGVDWREGETGVLVCLSEGQPPPGQWWFKDDGFGGFASLRQTDRIRIRKSAVIIENVGVQDAGIYVCNATNRHGSVHQQIHVRVGSPLVVQVLPTVSTADIGKTAEFSCWTNIAVGDSLIPGIRSEGTVASTRSDGRREPVKIRWFRNGKELTPTARIAFSPSGDKLRISYVQREDMGMIQCLVATSTDSAQATAQLRLGEASPHFIYRFIEQTLQPGQAISLKCAAAGNPTPRVIWKLDGFVPPISERLLIGQYVTMNGDVVSHLNITKTRVEDGGEYSCTVNNTHGTLVHSARLNIYGPPVIRSMPLITAVAGKTLTVKCPAAGFPLERPIVWEKDNQQLPVSRRQSVSADGILTVRDVDRSADVGAYACSARNKQGMSDKKSVQVQVVVAPKVSFEFPGSVSMGERLVVNCYVSAGDSPIELKWLKDSKPIVPDAERKHVSTTRGDFDLSLKINPVSYYDSGEYTCSATNRFGEARRTAKLVVRVPPKITPFSFPGSVQMAQSAQVVCALQEGDGTRTTLRWYRNGEPMGLAASGGSDGHVKVIEVQRAVSLLLIEGADSGDNGNYTCEAQSDIEGLSDAVTASLVVRVPPKWLVEPKDQLHVLSEDMLKIPCQAAGFPLPAVSWKKQMGRAGNYHDISVQQGQNLKGITEDVLSDTNGTLFIRSATKGHQGTYLCEASNGIGSDLSKVVRIIVNAPVRILNQEQNVTVRVNSNAGLQCQTAGDGPIEVSWRRSHSDSNIGLDPRYFLQNTNGSDGAGLLSELKINNVVRSDSGRYLCHASNPFGKDHSSLWLLVKDVPEPPRDLYVMGNGSRFVRLGWSLDTGSFGNSPVTQFIIKYAEGNFQESWGDIMSQFSEVSVPGDTFVETVNNLRPATTYHFTLFAKNEIGLSPGSKVLQVTTNGEPPPPPGSIEVLTVSSSELKVTWDQPLEFDDKTLLGYYIGFRRQREEEQYQFSAIDSKGLYNSQRHTAVSIAHRSLTAKTSDGLSRGEYFIRNLVPYTTYDIVMQAFNVYGAGELSSPVLATTSEDVPISAPQGLTCVPVNSQSIKVSFLPLSSILARGRVTGYKVYVELLDATEQNDEVLVRDTSGTSLLINGLQPWTNYSVQISALTQIGEGVLGSSIICQTDEDVPGKLEAIKVVPSSATSVLISWLPPKNRYGHLLNYVLYVYEMNRGSNIRKKNISVQNSFYEVENLRRNEKYEARIAAVSSKGEGKYASVQFLPNKKSGASIVTMSQHHYVVWKTDILLPCKSVGDPAPYLTWNKFSQQVKESDRILVRSDGSLILQDLRKEDEAVYTCKAVNEHGTDAINHTIHVQVPPGPPILEHGPATQHSMWISWRMGVGDRSPVKGYILHMKGREEWFEKKLSRHINTYEVTDLECGTSYQLYLTGYNAAGTGKESNVLQNVSTLGGPPTLAATLSSDGVAHVNVTWVRIKLDSWSDNGCPLKQCRVYYRIQDHHAKWQTVLVEMNRNTHHVDLTGLKPSIFYTVRVVCQNSAGENEHVFNVKTLSNYLSSEEDPKSPIWKTGSPAATTSSSPFYTDWRLMGPIIIATVAIVIAGTGVCLCLKKKPEGMGRSLEHLSGSTPSSSSYFKGNQRQSHQIYMTVKKATPVKEQDLPVMEHIPQYAEDIYPYATFDLNDPSRRETRFNGIQPTATTLERSRANSSSSRVRKLPRHQETYYTSTYNPYGTGKPEESEEYDSIESDSEIGTARPGEFFIEYRESMEKTNKAFDTSQFRGGNHYEFVPLTNHVAQNPFSKTLDKCKEKHLLGNHTLDAGPTGTGYKKQQYGSSRSQKHKSAAGVKYNPYGGTGVVKTSFNPSQIEPPIGFGDKYQQQQQLALEQQQQPTGSTSNEYAIAV